MKTLLAFVFLALTACATDDLQQQRYQAWYHTLTPEQQAVEDQRRHERSLAAMRALSLMNHGQGVFGPSYPTPPPMPLYNSQMPAYQPPQQPLHPQRQLTNCTSNVMGNQVYTNCY